jgi:hypothetical protein
MLIKMEAKWGYFKSIKFKLVSDFDSVKYV